MDWKSFNEAITAAVRQKIFTLDMIYLDSEPSVYDVDTRKAVRSERKRLAEEGLQRLAEEERPVHLYDT